MKDQFFRHDYNTTNDPKIICLIGNHGGLGYGIYWRVVEMLHQEDFYKLPKKRFIFEAIAKQMLTNAEIVENIIKDCVMFELFVDDDKYFWCNRVLRNIEFRGNISKERSISGKKGVIAKKIRNSKEAIAEQNLAKVSKEKNIIEKNIIEYNIKEYIKEYKEEYKELKKYKDFDVLFIEYSDLFSVEGFTEILIDWINYKKESKKEISKSNLKYQLREMRKFNTNGELLDTIQHAITHNWSGLFPISNNNKGNNNGNGKTAKDAEWRKQFVAEISK